MKLAVMQPYFFPYLGYFQGIHSVDKYLLYDQLAYLKEGWVHRNRFLVVNDQPAYFTANVKKKSSFARICDIELVENPVWRKKILHSIFLNYKSRLYFDEIYPLVESVVNADVSRIAELSVLSVKTVCEYLEISTDVCSDTSKYLQLEEKLADEANLLVNFPRLRLKHFERKVVRALEICRIEGANIFINAIGGQSLYSKDEFRANNVDLFFVQTRPYAYSQPASAFYPHLSIIDVLMNCGKAGTQQLLQQYDLV